MMRFLFQNGVEAIRHDRSATHNPHAIRGRSMLPILIPAISIEIRQEE
jgi:hypothetical protein